MRKIFIILFLLFFSFLSFGRQEQNINFKNIDNKQGLSQNGVTCIFQDKDGYMWFGTHYGLNRYNGLTIETYYGGNTKKELGSNTINVITQDSAGNIWIATHQGISILNPITEEFFNLGKYETKTTIFNQNILSMNLIDDKIILTSSKGIWKIDTGKELFSEEIAKSISKHIDHYKVKTTLNSSYLRVFEKDNNDSYWLTTGDKVLVAKIINNELIILDKITIEKSNKVTITAFLNDNSSNLWVGTSNNGLYNIHEEKGKYITTKMYPEKNSPNKFSRITNIIQDFENNILVTSRSDGTILISENEIKKKDLSQIKINSLELYTKKIKSIYQSRDKTLWIGSLGNGVYFQNKSGLKFKNYQIKDKINSPVVNNTRSITKDSFGRLWLGSLFEGLYIYDATNTKVEKLLLNDKSIFSLCQIDDSHILVGASDGLYIVSYDKRGFTSQKLFTENKIENVIFSITNSQNQYWVATERGLMSFTLTKNFQISNIVDYTSEIPLTSSSLNAMRVVSYDPHHNFLWIGSKSNGLIKAVLNEDYTIKDFYAIHSASNQSNINEYICDIFIENKNQIWVGSRNGLIDLTLSDTGDISNIKKFTTTEGFPSNLVQSVKGDLSGNLWIGTNKGLVKFNKQTHDIITYDINDGVQGLEFSEHASYKDFNNFLYFGGTNGVSEFSPDFSVSEGFSEGVDIKDIIINGININERRYFKNSTNAISLAHFENNVKINFISPNFINPKKQKYLYQLKGFDKDWKNTKNHIAEYSNLPKGNYVFEVKTIYENGNASHQTSTLEIKIEPSFWLTLPAYVLYLIVVITFIYIISTITKKRLERKNKEVLKNQYHEQMEKVNKSKIEFFINISHEIRTPLTLILCSIEKLLSNFKLNQKQENVALTIDRNVHRILELTNELLSIRKMETGNYNLKVQYDDIMLFLHNTKVSFDGLAKKKGIKLSIKTHTDELFMWFDKNALEKIIYNLISNAIKYTNEKGTIEVEVQLSRNKQFLEVKVIDTGMGIDKNHVAKIFNRFYNQGGNIDRYVSGFGIGLSLTKSLVDLHKGTISVSSELNVGSVFTLSLPLDENLFSEEEKVDRMLWDAHLPTVLNTIDDNDEKEEIPVIQPKESVKENSKSSKPTLLYIDDNTELLISISDYFSDHYRIFTAENGVSGLKIANDLQPDIIISDIVMPEMDGLELCKTLKNDINTSHIPVILLTAMGDIDSQLHGVESGADYYIPKPFNIKLLSLTVKNLIESRNKLKNLFLTNDYSDSKDITTNNKDQEFIDKLLSYVNDHLEEDNLNINTIADAFAMSRSTFFRKIKVITGTTGKQFIDSLRLKKATQLLTQSDLNISEIGYAVGHSNPQYFSKWFKSYYKVSPTEYKSQNKKRE